MKKIFTIASIASLLALAGCSPATSDVSGSVSIPAVATNLPGYDPTEPGESCYFGIDGNPYTDIAFGAQVKLRDASGAVIAISSLGTGGHLLGWTEFGVQIYSDNEFVEDFCNFKFTFEQIALDDGIYSIEVANRGEVLYSKDDLLNGVSLSLGR
jgi:hypothetical protein